MFILLPPSEGKSDAPGTRAVPRELADDTRGVLAMLRKLNVADRRKWYGVRDNAVASEWQRRNLAVLEERGIPALERYTGVVYAHIDPATLRKRKDAEKRLLIVSGLWGLVAAGTPIPEYKLPIHPKLAAYWRPINTERLRRIAKGKPVLSLLPQAYAKAVDYAPLIPVDFKVSGGKRSAGHFGKAIKGKFVRYLIENGIRSPEGFGGFREDGYRFDGEHFVQD